MKTLITIMSIVLVGFTATAQTEVGVGQIDPLAVQVVEASCGQCNFGLTSKQGCDLAIKLGGKAYWVDGTDIHSHGDAHGNGGFCTTVRKAEVAGTIVDGRYKASHFVLLPLEHKEKTGHEGHNH